MCVYIYIIIPRTYLQVITNEELAHCHGLSRHSSLLLPPIFLRHCLCYLAKNKGVLGTHVSHGRPHDKHQALVLATHKQGWGAAACVSVCSCCLKRYPGSSPAACKEVGNEDAAHGPQSFSQAFPHPQLRHFLASSEPLEALSAQSILTGCKPFGHSDKNSAGLFFPIQPLSMTSRWDYDLLTLHCSLQTHCHTRTYPPAITLRCPFPPSSYQGHGAGRMNRSADAEVSQGV